MTPAEIKLLEAMDEELAREIAAIVAKADEWKQRIQRVRAAAKAVDDAASGGGNTDSIVTLAKEVVDTLEQSPRVAKLLPELDAIATKVKEVEAAWRSAPFDSDEWIGMSEEEFRQQLRETIELAVEEELAVLLDDTFLSAITGMGKPADYVRRFLDEEVSQWIEQPRKIDDADLEFRIERPDPRKSIFAADSNLKIRVRYGALDAEVVGTGLYFRYDPGKEWPVPDLSQLRIDEGESIERTVMGNLTKLATTFPGLPFTIENVQFLGFERSSDNGRRGGIRFDAVVKLLGDAEGFGVTAKDITVYPGDGVVEWKVFEVNNDKWTLPVPPVFRLMGVRGSFSVTSPLRVSIGTHITFMATTPDVITLKVDLSFPIPVKSITVEGDLIALRTIQFGTTEATADFDKGFLKGTSTFQTTVPYPGLLRMKGDFQWDGDGLRSDGELTLFDQEAGTARLMLHSNGHGRIEANRGLKLASLDTSDSTLVTFEPGLQHLKMHSVFCLKGQTLGWWGPKVDIGVEVDGDADRDPPIHVRAHCWRATAEFDLPNLKELTPDRITAELAREFVQMQLNGLAALESLAKWGEQLAANAEEDFRGAVYQQAEKYGLTTVKTGNAAVDERLGELSSKGKEAAQRLGDLRAAGHKFAWSAAKNPLKSVEGIGSFFSFGRRKKPAPPDPAELARGEKLAAVAKKMEPFIAAAMATTIEVQETVPRQTGSEGQAAGAVQNLSVRFTQVMSAPGEEPDSFVIAVMTAATGSRFGREDTAASLTAGSDVQACAIVMHSLLAAAGKPKADIVVPTLKHGSGLPDSQVTAMVRDRLLRLMEVYFPEVAINGDRRLYEKYVEVENATNEPVAVSCRIECRFLADGEQKWKWRRFRGSTAPSVLIEPQKTVLIGVDMIAKQPAGEDAQVGSDEARLAHDNSPAGRRMHLAVERESGWIERGEDDRWLVEKNPWFGNQRVYHGTEPARYRHTIRSNGEVRDFRERLVRVRNATEESLTVDLTLLKAVADAKARRERIRPFKLGPGEAFEPKNLAGFRHRAAGFQFTAEGEQVRFDAHAREPLWIGDQGGTGTYRGREIGEFELILKESEPKPGS